MNYLLINHVPLARGSRDGRFLVGDLWLEDLRAQARAIQAVGGELTVATPCAEHLQPTQSGSFNLVEIDPAEHGFTYAPLPHYLSMRRFLAVRKQVLRALQPMIEQATIVQMGYGGHPVALGQLAWPIAGELGRRRIWVFDGADPFPRLERGARETGNPLKRLGKGWLVRSFERFCEQAVRKADLVFAHNAAVVERFAGAWGEHCHRFDRSFVTDELLIDDNELAQRQAAVRDTSQPLRLVVAGRQTAIKATDHVLQAVARARQHGAAVELDVIGEGDALDQLKTLARELELDREGGEAVRFRGAMPYGQPLFEAWAKAHAMVVTNLTDEISRNVLLSMARGLALISYRNPGTDTMLESADAAWLVERGNIDALAETFVQAHQDRNRLSELLAHGHRLAQSKSLDATHRQRAELAAACANGTANG